MDQRFRPASLVPAGLFVDGVAIESDLVLTKLIPANVLKEHRSTADHVGSRPISRTAAVVVVAIWIMSIGSFAWLIYNRTLRWAGTEHRRYASCRAKKWRFKPHLPLATVVPSFTL